MRGRRPSASLEPLRPAGAFPRSWPRPLRPPRRTRRAPTAPALRIGRTLSPGASLISPTVALARAASTAAPAGCRSYRAGRRGQRGKRRLGARPGPAPRRSRLRLAIWASRTAVLSTFKTLDLLVRRRAILVQADHSLLARVDARLGAGRRLLDPQLRDAGLDRLGHAAQMPRLREGAARPARARSCVSRST